MQGIFHRFRACEPGVSRQPKARLALAQIYIDSSTFQKKSQQIAARNFDEIFDHLFGDD